MVLSKLGDYIEQIEHRNSDLKYGADDVRGVSNNKQFMPTKANNAGRDLERFYIISPEEFVYNSRTTRMGDKVGLGYNSTNETFLTSWNNSAFRVKQDALHLLSPTYLYMYYNRPEFDRYARYNSWGSSTELFSWDDMCDININLPPIQIQKKYVDIYNSIVLNQAAYEQGLEDLKLTCHAYLDELRRDLPHTEISKYVIPFEKRNHSRLGAESVRGISTSKEFISTKANLNGVNLDNYKVVPPEAIAYVADTSRRGEKISLALNGTNHDLIVSSISTVFETRSEELLPSYLMMFYSRAEFDRYARYNSWGSARETFSWEDMCEVKIPIPDIDTQQSIVNIYNAYLTRRDINEKLKAQIKDICPVLIQGSIKEAKNIEVAC